MDREVKPDVFMASYGENEVRFYTNELHEPELIDRIIWTENINLESVLTKIRKVTTTI